MPSVDVRLVDVVKKYGENVVVDHIDLEIQSGEFFTLLGPSGCGKTTTLRMIGGFEPPTSGLIELKGEDVTWLPPYKRHVNTVFQNYALFPHLTIYENVAFGLRRTKVGDDEVKRRVTEMLQLVELPGYERRKPTQISGGQAQRVALARALINKPSVLLLDEPLGALDLKLRKQMQVELKRIQQEVGITFIFVTHDQEEAMTMSDRIAVMNRGRYEQLGDPAGLYERPRTRFVAGFLGVSNLLATTPDAPADGYAVCRLADGSAVRVPLALTEGLERYEVGVRPEKIRLRALEDDVPAGQNQMLGTIRDVSYLGVSTSYIVEARGGATITVYEQNVERATRSELWEPGEEVRMTWSPDHTFAVAAGGDAPPADPGMAMAAAGDAGAPVPPPVGSSRRKFLIGGAVAVAAVGVGAFLASTSGGGTTPTPSASAGAGASTPPKPSTAPSAGASAGESAAASAITAPETGVLQVASWIGYMDVDESGTKHPTLDKFSAETGITVNYVEAVDGNEPFFSSNLKGPLDAGLPTAWDAVVLTDWMIARLIRLDWLEVLDRDAMPNFVANLLPIYNARSFDPNTHFAAPWQSGMTGLGFNQKKTGPLTSLAVLFSDQYTGKLTYLDEMRDTVGLSALHLGFDPGTLTEDQFQQSVAQVGNAVKQGWVRQVEGNSYVNTMQAGDAVLAMAWSGDVLTLLVPDQTSSQDFQWVLADEGGMLWTDNVAVPKGSPRRGMAQQFINFYYDPTNAAVLEAYVNYVCPVAGAREVMLTIDADLANNPLIFPPADWFARLHQFRATTAVEEEAWSEAFTKVMGL